MSLHRLLIYCNMFRPGGGGAGSGAASLAACKGAGSAVCGEASAAFDGEARVVRLFYGRFNFDMDRICLISRLLYSSKRQRIIPAQGTCFLAEESGRARDHELVTCHIRGINHLDLILAGRFGGRVQRTCL